MNGKYKSLHPDISHHPPFHMSHLISSESVTKGHPDKVADQISDAVVDACLGQDPSSRVACETLVKNNAVVVAGEISTRARLDIEAIARVVIANIGYTDPALGFDARGATVLQLIGNQSGDIARGVDRTDPREQGAGDQGLMYGYATNETFNRMPLPIHLAHLISRNLQFWRESGELPYLRPDGKSQVTVEYASGEIPPRIDAVVLSTQHSPDVTQERLRDDVRTRLEKLLENRGVDSRTTYLINPTGNFEIGGPVGDCGLTGRKIIVDTYGGVGRHGGGAFSGKDPSKVDRSGAYAARWAAKHVVNANLADSCEVQIAYAIGVAKPVSIHVDTFGTGVVDDDQIARAIRATFDLRPAAIIEDLRLLQTKYLPLASNGQMGREDLDVAWERTPRVDDLMRHISG
ncbi:MAG: S-adenosylmethionine synthetase [Candidatus Peregrinibacteria bacterium Gr01-1014_25]|nr:MAG: S-adenosylmethionine synthetase [Candidatus Peregrinibacteria bacterium Gr01-1014_25]